MNNSSSSTMASSKLARRRQGGSLPKESPIMESLTSNDPNANAGGKFFNLIYPEIFQLLSLLGGGWAGYSAVGGQ